MQQTDRDLLLKILEIIDYQNDKEAFVNRFSDLNRQEALLNLLERLPRDVQEKISGSEDIAEVEKVISSESYAQELASVSAEALGSLIQKVIPTIRKKQKDQIDLLIKPQ